MRRLKIVPAICFSISAKGIRNMWLRSSSHSSSFWPQRWHRRHPNNCLVKRCDCCCPHFPSSSQALLMQVSTYCAVCIYKSSMRVRSSYLDTSLTCARMKAMNCCVNSLLDHSFKSSSLTSSSLFWGWIPTWLRKAAVQVNQTAETRFTAASQVSWHLSLLRARERAPLLTKRKRSHLHSYNKLILQSYLGKTSFYSVKKTYLYI